MANTDPASWILSLERWPGLVTASRRLEPVPANGMVHIQICKPIPERAPGVAYRAAM